MKRVQTRKPFIYYEALKQWEIITIVIYALITLVIALSSFVFDIETRQNSVIGYAIVTQLSFLFFLYVSLRNFAFYLMCLGFGFMHFILFLCFKGSPELQMEGNPSGLLANTLPLLFLFQILRYLSVKKQQREFVSPAKGSEGDLIENKKPTVADYIISIIYMGVWFGLTMFSVSFS